MTIFEAIAQGFRKTPEQTVNALLISAGILIIIPLASLLYKAVMKKRTAGEWENDFQAFIREKDLTVNELDLLDDLFPFLKDPRRKILMLHNRNTFLLALGRLEEKTGHPQEFGENLEKKLFGEEKSILPEDLKNPLGPGRPARYIASDGKVFTGRITSGKGNVVGLGFLETMKARTEPGKERLLVQDFRGILIYPVSSVSRTGEDSLRLEVSPRAVKQKDRIAPSSIDLYPPGTSRPIETRLLQLNNGIGAIENPDGILKTGQTVKLSFRTEFDKHYRINAVVTGLSGRKRIARLKFGYLKPIP